jgi:hypothetical protein
MLSLIDAYLNSSLYVTRGSSWTSASWVSYTHRWALPLVPFANGLLLVVCSGTIRQSPPLRLQGRQSENRLGEKDKMPIVDYRLNLFLKNLFFVKLLFVRLWVCLSAYLLVYSLICLSVHLSVCLSLISLSFTYLSACLCASLSVCVPICLSVPLSVCLSPIPLSVCLSVLFATQPRQCDECTRKPLFLLLWLMNQKKPQ